MPNPLEGLASGWCDCVNGSKIRSRFSAAMPMPLSPTVSTACGPRASSVTVILPPGSVYLAAFSTRLLTT